MKSFLTSILIVGLAWPVVVLAQDIQLFQTIPFLEGANPTMESYVNALYRLAIAAASLLVVVKLIGAGVKYMFSEVVTDKADAKKDIRTSLLGMLIILAAVTILNTINPELTRLDFLSNAQSVSPDTSSGRGGSSGSNNQNTVGGGSGGQTEHNLGN